jgi:hypothetical protein
MIYSYFEGMTQVLDEVNGKFIIFWTSQRRDYDSLDI